MLGCSQPSSHCYSQSIAAFAVIAFAVAWLEIDTFEFAAVSLHRDIQLPPLSNYNNLSVWE